MISGNGNLAEYRCASDGNFPPGKVQQIGRREGSCRNLSIRKPRVKRNKDKDIATSQVKEVGTCVYGVEYRQTKFPSFLFLFMKCLLDSIIESDFRCHFLIENQNNVF